MKSVVGRSSLVVGEIELVDPGDVMLDTNALGQRRTTHDQRRS